MGPDDELNVYNWGRVNQTVKLKVDRDGSVMVPEIGPIQVGGLTFGQAKKRIEGRMSQITGVEVGVMRAKFVPSRYLSSAKSRSPDSIPSARSRTSPTY